MPQISNKKAVSLSSRTQCLHLLTVNFACLGIIKVDTLRNKEKKHGIANLVWIITERKAEKKSYKMWVLSYVGILNGLFQKTGSWCLFTRGREGVGWRGGGLQICFMKQEASLAEKSGCKLPL